MADIIAKPNNDIQNITNTSSAFHEYLKEFNLPSENIIATSNERKTMMENLPAIILSVSEDKRSKAYYLSKFVAASSIGLFDAALNYIWNEVVKNLREKVSFYGLDIFFDSAVGGEKRELYSKEEDLALIKDIVLLDTCKKLEVVAEITYKKLAHILDMRNNIGASHPNMDDITAFELLAWLQNCVHDVLGEHPSAAAINIKKIVDNIKNRGTKLTDVELKTFNDNIKDLSSKMASNLLSTFFGLFVSNDIESIKKENILVLSPSVWNVSKEEAKYDIGLKISYYRNNLEIEKIKNGETFLEYCGGNSYLPKDVIASNINVLCDNLYEAHYGWDNYIHEVEYIKKIMSFIKEPKDIPESCLSKLNKTVLLCRIGKSVDYQNGVSPVGKRYYDLYLKLLNKEQAINALSFLKEHSEYINGSIKCLNFIEIIEMLKSPLYGERINEIIDYIINYAKKGKISNLSVDKNFKDLSSGIL